MKLRIQFMYENGSTPVWQMLAEAESFSDFLNRTEYITDINAYDRKKLVEYQDLQEQIAAQKEDLESDMTELVAMQEEKAGERQQSHQHHQGESGADTGRSGGCAVQRRGPGG